MQAIMDGLSGAGRQMVAPMALFFLTAEKQLIPLAIQLQQRIGEQNPVFLPTDPPNIWYIDCGLQVTIRYISFNRMFRNLYLIHCTD